MMYWHTQPEFLYSGLIIKVNTISIICPSAGASTPTSAHFGQGTGQIWLDDLICTGTEARLVDCGHRPFGVHNCGHNEDVGTRCIPYFCKAAKLYF